MSLRRSPFRRRATVALVALAAIALAPFTPRPLLAHTRLTSSDPASGAEIKTSPAFVRLTFNEAPTPAFSSIELAGSAGAVALGPLMADPASALTLVALVPARLAPGRYTVRWRAAAKDGHPTQGSFTFSIVATLKSASTAVTPPATPPITPAPSSAPSPSAQPVPPPSPAPPPSATPADASSLAYTVIRFVMYASTIGLIGCALFVLLLLRRLRSLGLGSDLFAEDAAAAARRIAAVCATVLLLATPARLLAQSMILSASMPTILGELWGRAWVLQAAGSLVALAAVRSARGIAVARWRMAGVGAIAVAAGFALTGHAAAMPSYAPLVELADVVHLVAAGAWVGTLGAVALAGIPAALRTPESVRGATAASLVNAFSPLALFSAAVLAITGAFAAWEHLGGLQPLFSSAYGRTLLIKLGTVAVVAAIGAVNWRLPRPQLGSEPAARGIRRSALRELAVAAVVIAVTAVLVATPTPGDAPAAPVSSAPVP